LLFACVSPVEIDVDTEKPEANGPFIVYDAGQTIPGVTKEAVGYYYWGYYIFYKMDIRYTLDDPEGVLYKGHLSAFDTIQLSVPAWDYNHLKNRDAFEKEDNVGPNVIDAMDDSHDRYLKEKAERFSKHYKLKFKNHTLSAKTISADATDDEIVPWDIVKCPWKHKKANLKGTDYYACWAIVRTDKKSRKKGKASKNDKELSEAAKKLQSMGISLGGGDSEEEEEEGGGEDDEPMG